MESLAAQKSCRKKGIKLHSSSYTKEEPEGTKEMDDGPETDLMSIVYIKEEPTLKEEPLDERDMELDFQNSLGSRGQKSYAGLDPYSSYKAPGGDDDIPQAAGYDGEACAGAVPQAAGGGDAVLQAAGGDDGEAGADPAKPPLSQPTRGKGKGKVKAKPTQAAAGEETARQDNSLTQEQEEDLVEWMRENEGVWRRGHRLYKTRRTLWAVKAKQFGVTIEHLEGWWKSAKDWFVRLMKKKSGEARKKLTDRELWILDRISFYTPQLKSNEGESQPMSNLQRQEPHTQPQPEPRPLPLLDSDSESEQLQPSQQPAADEDQSLEGLESSDALQAREAGEAGPCSYSQSSRGRKRRRQETAEAEWMQELRDSIKANAAMMAQLVQQKPPVSGREPFITYVQDSLRTLPDNQYLLVRAKITSLLHSLTPTAADRPPQPQSGPPQPAGQFQFQPPPPPQQFFSHTLPPQQPPFSQHPPLQQPSFNQAPPPQQPPFSQHSPLQQPPFSQHPPLQ